MNGSNNIFIKENDIFALEISNCIPDIYPRIEMRFQMIQLGGTICPTCGGELKYYDRVRRIVRTKGRKTGHIRLRRYRCVACKAMHRELPNYIFPYKQYEVEVIRGVLSGFITSDTIGYEDYPCEMTMIRWRSQKTHIPL